MALIAASTTLFLPACATPCEGAGCSTSYNGALVSVHAGSELGEGALDPLDATAWVEGTASQGPDWSVALAPGALVVGIPEESRVTWVSLDGSGALPLPEDEPRILDASGGARLGAAVLRLPDNDGDGIAELLVGAPAARRGGTTIDDGAVLLFSGLGDGPTTGRTAEDADLTILGEEAAGQLGRVLAACGDLDGDGLADWAAAAPLASGHADLAGRVVLVRSTDVAGADPLLEADALPTSWFAADVGARAGNALDCGNDLTADGLADLVVGAPFADSAVEAGGAVFVIEGGADMATGGPDRLLEEAARATLHGTVAEEWLGWSVATGDLDGDGAAELVAGAPGWQAELGRIKGWRINGGVRPGPDGGELFTATPDFTIIGEQVPGSFGETVRVVDLDGDDVAEILVGAPRLAPLTDAGGTAYDAGKLYQFAGQPGGDWFDIGLVGADIAERTWVRPRPWLRTGQQVAVGDYDGDDVPDLALLHRFNPG